MSWTNLSYAYGSVLTSAKITQQYDNLTAFAHGDGSSPKIETNNALQDRTIGGLNIKREMSTSFVTSVAAYGYYYPSASIGFCQRSSGWNPSWWELCVNSVWTYSMSWSSGVTLDNGAIVTDGNYWRWKNGSSSARYVNETRI
ncbi:MAG: hypothetical protein R3254_00965 [Thiomicrorhabdus sp.]|nr:hypothetical protein [Thiomicrorhabdus sp.]